ncbi:hypothetical protein POM88_043086 [Heracleum sosnowskyi]|uniref:FAR1 domain-containing protein n=1 Tax=Heracleum sosnowskyi TaxID=360622 RepID=A0AAD8H0B1_9APIA|nr:hypothetical protein POM88_043086 [Heracleum sosnowskyi]
MQSFVENEEVFYNSAETSPNPTPNSDNLTHDLGDNWIPECDIEKKPIIGQLFPDIDTAFNFYYHYGSTCGFVSRRSTEKKNKQNKITRKYFVFSRAGLPKDDKSEEYY